MKTLAIVLFVVDVLVTIAVLILFWLYRGAKYAYEHQDEIARKEHEEQGWVFPD